MLKRALLFGLVWAVVLSAPFATADDWPQFRGTHRNGVSAETGLAASWGADGPKELWRIPIGPGYSAVSVVGDRLYTMYAAEIDGEWKEIAVALSAKDGSEIWRKVLGERFNNEFGDGPRTTPTVHDEKVYVMDSTGNFAALKAKDGSVIWKKDFKAEYGVETPRFGYSTSPVVDGDRVVVQTGGGEDNNYVAFHKDTGETIWSRGSGSVGYNSALPVSVGDNRRYVYVTDQLYCIDEEGGEVWAHEWPQGETHAMPIHIPPDMLYLSGAEGIGARLFRVKEADGKGEAELIWEQPFMRNHFSSAVVHDGTIFGFDNATLKAISVKDGQMAWGKRGLGKGSVILADGLLMVLSDRGKLLLLEATAEGYKEKGSVQALEDLCWTAPTLSDGKLYLRNHTELVVYDLR